MTPAHTRLHAHARAKADTTAKFKTATLFAMAAALIVALAPEAEAKPRRAPFVTSIEFACAQLKHEAERLFREYRSASTGRRREILSRLTEIGRQWDAATCRQHFGDIGTKMDESPSWRDHAITASPDSISRSRISRNTPAYPQSRRRASTLTPSAPAMSNTSDPQTAPQASPSVRSSVRGLALTGQNSAASRSALGRGSRGD